MVNAVQAVCSPMPQMMRRLLHQFATGFPKSWRYPGCAGCICSQTAHAGRRTTNRWDYVFRLTVASSDVLTLPVAEEIAPNALFEPALEPVADVEPLSEPVDSAVEPSVPDELYLLADVRKPCCLCRGSGRTAIGCLLRFGVRCGLPNPTFMTAGRLNGFTTQFRTMTSMRWTCLMPTC